MLYDPKYDVKTALLTARNLIQNKENWCQFSQGLTRDGHSRCDKPWADDVYRRCALGAISAATSKPEHWSGPLASLVNKHMDGGVSIITAWNNTHTHEEVLAAFDAAIAAVDP